MAKYNKDIVKEMCDWVRENGLIEYGGARLTDFLNQFRIDDMTYYRWLKLSEFSDAIKKAKEEYRAKCENTTVKSLFTAANGYEYEQTTTEYMDVNGKPRIKKQTKKNVRVEPNVGAAIFLLTNIAPERWKNRQDNRLSVDDSVTGFNINIVRKGDDLPIASSEDDIEC